jgi:hypothetical protein
MNKTHDPLIHAVLAQYQSSLEQLKETFRQAIVKFPTMYFVDQHEPPYRNDDLTSSVLARWCVSLGGLERVPLTEPAPHLGERRGSFFEREYGRFVIEKHRRVVTIDEVLGPLNGHAAVYLVQIAGQQVRLKYLRQLWIS